MVFVRMKCVERISLMELFGRINDRIPIIFEDIIRRYGFNFEKITSSSSIMYKADYGFVMSIDRDYVDINFLRKEGNIIMTYWIQGFLIQKLDDNERSRNEEERTLETYLLGYLFTYEKSLQTKCKSILMGQMDWVDDLKKTPICDIRELNAKEYEKYGKFFV